MGQRFWVASLMGFASVALMMPDSGPVPFLASTVVAAERVPEDYSPQVLKPPASHSKSYIFCRRNCLGQSCHPPHKLSPQDKDHYCSRQRMKCVQRCR
jgi:hypothetical protein